jgi:hypothetical protein
MSLLKNILCWEIKKHKLDISVLPVHLQTLIHSLMACCVMINFDLRKLLSTYAYEKEAIRHGHIECQFKMFRLKLACQSGLDVKTIIMY